jgi:hypothetical protein
VSDLTTFQVHLGVNDTLLNITRVWVPTWDPEWIFYGLSYFSVDPEYKDTDSDGVIEQVLAGVVIFSGTSSGNGTLAIIEFEVYYIPEEENVSCDLSISDPFDTFLQNSSLNDIDAGRINGYYELNNIQSETTPEDMYLVVRGLNNKIYYRTYNSTIDNWENWNVVPSGFTCDSPAAARNNETLYLVVRGLDGLSLWFTSINLTDKTFSGWTRLAGETTSTPTLVSSGLQLSLLVRGLNNRIYIRFYNYASDDWDNWSAIPTGATCDKPAATFEDNLLYIVVRGFSTIGESGNNTLWHNQLNLSSGDFLGWSKISGATNSAPTLTASFELGKTYLIVKGLNDKIYINTWENSNWEGWSGLVQGATYDSPGGIAERTHPRLNIVVLGSTGSTLWHCYVDLLTNDQSNWMKLSGASPSAPILVN